MEIFSDAFLAMGTQCDVVLPNVTSDFAKQIFEVIKSQVEELEDNLDRFFPDSPTARLCKSSANEWLSVPDEIWDLLTICYDFYQMTNGAFDVTVGPLVSLWESNAEPTAEQIEEVRKQCGFDKVEFDIEKQKIKFSQSGIEFDFGAIQKGFALDVLKPLLLEKNVKNAIISFGEDAVLALGNHPEGDYWPIGIRNQLNPLKFVHVFSACNEIVLSSGTMEKPDLAEGVAKSYIISPATGLPVTNKQTVSVKANSALMGEFVATTWLILPDNDKAILSESLNNLEILEVNYLENDIQTKLSILNEKE